MVVDPRRVRKSVLTDSTYHTPGVSGTQGWHGPTRTPHGGAVSPDVPRDNPTSRPQFDSDVGPR